jgi:NAD(P)-dependent dehydrogenase (short-subunit alcohol dehydrogenase family)
MTERVSRGAVVVTGASKGIGRACAMRLDRQGFRVFAGVRRVADAEALRKEASDRLEPVLVDVTDQAAVTALGEHVARSVGDDGLVGLVNNAGIAVAGPLEFLPPDELRRQLEVNVTGQLAVTQALLPVLRRARGRIVNIGSISGRLALPFTGPYAASKHALEALTDALRIELMPWGIHVSILQPGAIATPIWETSIAAAEAVSDRYPPQAHDYYGKTMERVRAMVADNGRPEWSNTPSPPAPREPATSSAATHACVRGSRGCRIGCGIG